MTGFRRRKTLPSYRKHKATGQAVVTLNGRDFYLGVHGSQASVDAYDAYLKEWLTNGRRIPQEALTINELIVLYLEHADAYYRKDGEPTSQVDRIRAALRFVHAAYGRLEPVEFGPLKLKGCREAMIAAGLSRKTCNAYVGEIRAMFRWGTAAELLDVSVVQALASVAGLRAGRSEAHETRPVPPVPDDRIAALEPFLPPQVWAMIRLQDLTAMRPGELVIMRTGDVDRDGPVWFYYPERHKSEHHGLTRGIGLGPQAQAVLLPFLKADSDAYLFDPRDVEADRLAGMRANRQTPVQPSQRNRRKPRPTRKPGERYTTQSYGRAIKRACELAFGMPADLRNVAAALRDVPAKERDAERKRLREAAAAWRAEHCWSPHQLRHTALTRARRTDGLETAQAVGGHTKANTTEIYAEVNRERAVRYLLQHG